LQACMEGFQVTTMAAAVGEVDIFVSCTGNYNRCDALEGDGSQG